MTRFLLCKRQPSKKAWMVDVNGFVRFIPRSFKHYVEHNTHLFVELPKDFEI